MSHSNFYDANQPGLTLLRSCKHGPKVLETSAGEVIKIFYPKKRLSSNLYRSYAKRFCRNAKRLSALSIEVPLVKNFYFCAQSKAHYVSYDKLPGVDVYTVVQAGNESILPDVLAYISQLHSKGIFFRAIHLSNVLYQGDNAFALLDIADVQVQKKPLSLYKRCRNLRHIFFYPDDKAIWGKLGVAHWLQLYCQLSALSTLSKKILIHYFAYKKRLK